MECKQIDMPVLEHFGLKVLSDENPLSARLTNLTDRISAMLASGKLNNPPATFVELCSLEMYIASCASQAQALEHKLGSGSQRQGLLIWLKRRNHKKG